MRRWKVSYWIDGQFYSYIVIAETKAEAEERVVWDSLEFGEVIGLEIIPC